jgi:hypothetical protein
MHKRFIICALAALLISAILPSQAPAGDVYDRSIATISTTAGTATWTNTAPYAAIELKRIWIERNLVAADTQTITRVFTQSSLTITQSVGSVTVSGSAGSTASFTAAYLRNADKLVFAGTGTTGGVAVIEYVVSSH